MSGCPECDVFWQPGRGWLEDDTDIYAVKPCPRCQPRQHRRWTMGHLPCPHTPICPDCRQATDDRTVDGGEFLPVQDSRYERERLTIEGEFDG